MCAMLRCSAAHVMADVSTTERVLFKVLLNQSMLMRERGNCEALHTFQTAVNRIWSSVITPNVLNDKITKVLQFGVC